VTFKSWLGLFSALLLVAIAAVPLNGIVAQRAEASSCAKACYANHSECRRRTKNNPICQSQLHQCLRKCVNR
jgi:hypothetical protein